MSALGAAWLEVYRKAWFRGLKDRGAALGCVGIHSGLVRAGGRLVGAGFGSMLRLP